MKTTKQQGAKAPARETARLSVRISREAYQRLFVQSVMDCRTASEILDGIILATCREYSLPGKLSERHDKSHRVISPADVTDSAPSPALQDAA